MSRQNGGPPSLPNAPIVPQQAGGGGNVGIAQALALAGQYQAAGRLQEAEALLRRIMVAQPACAPAYHLLGVVAHQAGRTDLAVNLVGQAIALDDAQGLFHTNRGEMCRLLGRLEEAITHGERAVSLDPANATAHSNLGIALFDKKDYERAETCQRRAIELEPGFARALNNLGSIHMRHHKDNAQATGFFEQAGTADPNYPEPLNNLGALLVEEEKPDEALAALEKALALNPRYAEAHCNIGCALRQKDENDKALGHLATALGLRPVYPEASYHIAGIRLEEENPEEAERVLSGALENSPDNADLLAELGVTHNELGFPEKAEADFARALEIDAEHTGALNGLGNLRLEQGRKKEAETNFRRAMKIDPEKIEAHFNIAQVKKFKAGDADLAALEERAATIENLSDKKATQLHFALGKVYDDLGEAEKAFPHFLEGCRLKRATFAYSVEENTRLFTQVCETFDPAFLKARRGRSNPSKLPALVLGMPRSGTTLTEQIISSHPDVHGAGELRDLARATDENFPAGVANLSRDDLSEIAARYVASLQARAPEAERITDKMPLNFLFIGLLHVILPNAKIVHVHRDPRDTCLSNFTRLFGRNQHQSYDLRELGLYYRDYAKVMAHWRAVLPKGAFYELRYEDLVADTETETRRLLDYLELDWDDACLAFHDSKRQIRTASLTQVREPIYASSVGRWKPYEAFLGPLIEALEI
jgi:tetratricopeptide (TPR) repeat protein